MEEFCQFCNEKREEDHIQICPVCEGQLHASSSVKVCATCGRSFPLDVKPRKAHDQKVREPVTEEIPVTPVVEEEE